MQQIRQEQTRTNPELKWVEDALWKSEGKLRIIFDRASDGILIADAITKKFLQGNTAICSMLGYTKEEIESLTIKDIYPPKDTPHVLDEFQKLVKVKKVLAEDLPVLRKDRSLFVPGWHVCCFMQGKLGTIDNPTGRRATASKKRNRR